MNAALFGHAWRANRWRLALILSALVAWGTLLPIIYDAFGAQFRRIVEDGLLPPGFENLARLGGGDLFSMSGAVALGFVHPFAIALNLVFAVGYASFAIAGERQRGTLEVLLARPLSRRSVYVTHLVTVGLFVGMQIAALAIGAWAGAALTGRLPELGVANLPVQWFNVALLFWAFAAIALAASVSFDRLGPALGTSIAIVLVAYVLDVLATLWPDVAWLARYSLFAYVDGQANLSGFPRWGDMGLLAAVVALAVTYALAVFPRRDLAAPT